MHFSQRACCRKNYKLKRVPVPQGNNECTLLLTTLEHLKETIQRHVGLLTKKVIVIHDYQTPSPHTGTVTTQLLQHFARNAPSNHASDISYNSSHQLGKLIHTSWISNGVVGGLLSNITFSALVNLKGSSAFKKLWIISGDWWLHGVSWRYWIVWNRKISLIMGTFTSSHVTDYGTKEFTS